MAQLIHTFPAWSVVVGLVVLVLAGGLFLAADFLILPFFPAASWKRPWCWLSDHASDERDAGDDDQDDRCQRCTAPLPEWCVVEWRGTFMASYGALSTSTVVKRGLSEKRAERLAKKLRQKAGLF